MTYRANYEFVTDLITNTSLIYYTEFSKKDNSSVYLILPYLLISPLFTMRLFLRSFRQISFKNNNYACISILF